MNIDICCWGKNGVPQIINVEYFLNSSTHFNDVLILRNTATIRVLTSSAVDRRFETWFGEIQEYKTCVN